MPAHDICCLGSNHQEQRITKTHSLTMKTNEFNATNHVSWIWKFVCECLCVELRWCQSLITKELTRIRKTSIHYHQHVVFLFNGKGSFRSCFCHFLYPGLLRIVFLKYIWIKKFCFVGFILNYVRINYWNKYLIRLKINLRRCRRQKIQWIDWLEKCECVQNARKKKRIWLFRGFLKNEIIYDCIV